MRYKQKTIAGRAFWMSAVRSQFAHQSSGLCSRLKYCQYINCACRERKHHGPSEKKNTTFHEGVIKLFPLLSFLCVCVCVRVCTCVCVVSFHLQGIHKISNTEEKKLSETDCECMAANLNWKFSVQDF